MMSDTTEPVYIFLQEYVSIESCVFDKFATSSVGMGRPIARFEYQKAPGTNSVLPPLCKAAAQSIGV